MQVEYFKKQRSPVKKQTSGTSVELRLRRCETMQLARAPGSGCMKQSITKQCAFKGASGRTNSLLKTGLTSK